MVFVPDNDKGNLCFFYFFVFSIYLRTFSLFGFGFLEHIKSYHFLDFFKLVKNFNVLKINVVKIF